MHWFIIVCALIYLFISVNLGSIKYILQQESYRTGLSVVPVLLLANLFLGIYYNLSVWYKLTDKTYFGTILTIIGAFITLTLLFILIPIMGYLGAAYATLICYISIAALSYYFGNKYFPVPYQLVNGLIYIGLASALIWLQQQIQVENVWFNFVIANLFNVPFIVVVLIKENLITFKQSRT